MSVSGYHTIRAIFKIMKRARPTRTFLSQEIGQDYETANMPFERNVCQLENAQQ